MADWRGPSPKSVKSWGCDMDTHLPNAPVETARKKAPGGSAPGAFEATTREQAEVPDTSMLPRPHMGSNTQRILQNLADGDALNTRKAFPLFGYTAIRWHNGTTSDNPMVSNSCSRAAVSNVTPYWLEFDCSSRHVTTGSLRSEPCVPQAGVW